MNTEASQGWVRIFLTSDRHTSLSPGKSFLKCVPVFPSTSAGLSLECRSDVTKAIKMNPVYLLYTFGTPKSQCSVCNPNSHTQERWLGQSLKSSWDTFNAGHPLKHTESQSALSPGSLSAGLSQGFVCISDLCPHGQPGLYEGGLCAFFPSSSHEVGEFL